MYFNAIAVLNFFDENFDRQKKAVCIAAPDITKPYRLSLSG